MLLRLGAGSASDHAAVAAGANGGHAVLAVVRQLRHACGALNSKPPRPVPEAVSLNQAAHPNGFAAEDGAAGSDGAILCLTVHLLVAWKLL